MRDKLAEARRIAHTMPIYGAPDSDEDRVYKAVRSSMRACAASEKYMEAVKALGITDKGEG